MREDGSVPLDSMRVITYIALCLATLRTYPEIIKMCSEDMKVEPTHAVIRKVEDWMKRFELTPNRKIYGKNARWREVYAQFQLARENYMQNLRDEPLAHPRGRFTKLKELLNRAEVGVVKRVHIVKESVLDNEGNPLTDENGKSIISMRTIAEPEPDLATAVNIIKLMGQESGTLVVQHEHKHSFPELVKAYRKGQVEDAQYAMALPGALADEEQN